MLRVRTAPRSLRPKRLFLRLAPLAPPSVIAEFSVCDGHPGIFRLLNIGLGHAALIARALVLVAADFHVFALALLHERRELGIVILGNGLGRHLDHEFAAVLGDALFDVLDGLFQRGNTLGLVEALRCEDCSFISIKIYALYGRDLP